MKKSKTVKTPEAEGPKPLPADFATMLIMFRELAAETKKASTKKCEAEQAEREAYAKESQLSSEIREIWKASKAHHWQHMQMFKLPDGMICRVEDHAIWFEEVTPL